MHGRILCKQAAAMPDSNSASKMPLQSILTLRGREMACAGALKERSKEVYPRIPLALLTAAGFPLP